MRRIAVVLGLVAALSVSAAPASGWTYKNAFPRTWEWAQYDYPHNQIEYPTECKGPYENAHKRTQWACVGVFEFAEHWQVNIDAYGVQTWHFP
jgi:hypothetical protein